MRVGCARVGAHARAAAQCRVLVRPACTQPGRACMGPAGHNTRVCVCGPGRAHLPRRLAFAVVTEIVADGVSALASLVYCQDWRPEGVTGGY